MSERTLNGARVVVERSNRDEPGRASLPLGRPLPPPVAAAAAAAVKTKPGVDDD